MTPRAHALLAALVVGTVGSSAHAGGSDAMTAEALFTEGLALVKKGNYAEACPKFEQSYKLERATGALLDWAECEALLGKTASAWLLYRDALALAVETRKVDRAKEARARAAELEPKLCRLRIDAPAGLRVTRDDVSVDANALGTATPVDPGEHVVAAVRDAGGKMWSEHVTLRPSPEGPCETRMVAVPARWPGDQPVIAVALPPPRPTRTPPRDVPPPPGPRRYVSIGLAALGLSALGVGSGFGIAALGKKSDADHACFADGCTPAGSRLLASGQHAADIATGLFIGGVVALGIATVLWLTAR